MKIRLVSLPVVPALERHPDDGWKLAKPMALDPLSKWTLRALVKAFLPPPPAPRPFGVEDEVALHVRRMLRYMPLLTAVGFVLLMHVVNWSPLWRLRGLLPIGALPVEKGSQLLAEVGESRFLGMRLLLLGPKACILSTYFDRDDVHEALGYDPKGFMRERVNRRREILEGEDAQARRDEDVHAHDDEHVHGDVHARDVAPRGYGRVGS